ncbi:hypothetical protein [Bradyrhizobium sp. S69]|jgi:hypothetical protein|nr:hypothetical protein [Bradyrhizobium sp. S69]
MSAASPPPSEEKATNDRLNVVIASDSEAIQGNNERIGLLRRKRSSQ